VHDCRQSLRGSDLESLSQLVVGRAFVYMHTVLFVEWTSSTFVLILEWNLTYIKSRSARHICCAQWSINYRDMPPTIYSYPAVSVQIHCCLSMEWATSTFHSWLTWNINYVNYMKCWCTRHIFMPSVPHITELLPLNIYCLSVNNVTSFWNKLCLMQFGCNLIYYLHDL